MNFHKEDIWESLLKGTNMEWIDNVDWELAKAAYFCAISDLKIWTILKSWKSMKKAVRNIEKIHVNFCSAYENFILINNPDSCEFDSFGLELNEVLDSISYMYGKKFKPALDMTKVPWSQCPFKLSHPENQNISETILKQLPMSSEDLRQESEEVSSLEGAKRGCQESLQGQPLSCQSCSGGSGGRQESPQGQPPSHQGCSGGSGGRQEPLQWQPP